MKKRLLTSLLILYLGAGLIACGSKDSETAETAGTGSIFEPIDESTNPQNQTATQEDPASSLPENVEFVSADGFYSGYLQSSGKAMIGAANADGVLNTIVLEAQITDDNLVLYGNFGYRNSPEQDIISVSDEGVFAFTINDDTTFVLKGGEENEYPSREDFANTLSAISDSGLYFEVELQGSVATTVSISS